MTDEARRGRGWRGRVAFARRGRTLAFRPGAALVPEDRVGDVVPPGWAPPRDRGSIEGFVRIDLQGARLGEDPSDDQRAADETLELVDDLRARGVPVQPNHVFFADHDPECGDWGSVAGNPLAGNPLAGNPLAGNPLAGNPLAGNPLAGNPLAGNPLAGNGWPTPTHQGSGVRPSTARPAAPPPGLEPHPDAQGWPVVLVLDTGVPERHRTPESLMSLPPSKPFDLPDALDDQDDQLDPVAGHGTFIAGIVSRVAPGCRVIVERVLSGYGDGDEVEVARTLRRYVGRVDLVNMSFGTYSPFCPRVLARAIRAVQRGIGEPQAAGAAPRPAVVVASAGNDATFVPSIPANFPGVISVAALDERGPAVYSNYGPWVRACAPGTNIVSTFFTLWHPDQGDAFDGWASWSGTSFAAPHVVGALARAMTREKLDDPRLAVDRVVDAPGLLRLPWHGTVVNVT